jgi:prepilin-type N-terminal cleavage/methylation domain-containing protein
MQSHKSQVTSRKSKFQAKEQTPAVRCRPTTSHWLLPTGYSGFTLLEVLVALVVLAVALVGLLGLYNRSLALTIRAQRLSTATLLAQEMLTRTQLEGLAANRVTSGDFSDLHPGQYPEFRWRRTIRATPLQDLWELRVGVSWGEHSDESCELTLFTPLEKS